MRLNTAIGFEVLSQSVNEPLIRIAASLEAERGYVVGSEDAKVTLTYWLFIGNAGTTV